MSCTPRFAALLAACLLGRLPAQTADDTPWWPEGTAARWREVKADVRERFPRARQVSVPELLRELAAGAEPPRLLDARTQAEFVVSHLRGARHLADGDILADVPRDAPVVVYCSVGWRSSEAAERLMQQGYRDVRNLEGSLFEWANRRLPLVDVDGPTRKVHPYDDDWGRLLRAPLRAQPAAGDRTLPTRVIACDQSDHRLLLLESSIPWDSADAVAWSWRAADAPDLPAEHAAWFRLPTDAKRVRGGDQVLTCASGGGVALVRVADGGVDWHAHAGRNPHSAELLPDGNVVTVSSTDDLLRLHRIGGGEPEDQVLRGGHGAVWDHARSCLWVLGTDALVRYAYDRDAAPRLHAAERIALPELAGHDAAGGHDLFPVAGSDALLATDLARVWRFEVATRTLAPAEGLADLADVKAIDRIGDGGPALVTAASERWWTDAVRVIGAERVLRKPGARFYKVRFWRRNAFSYGG